MKKLIVMSLALIFVLILTPIQSQAENNQTIITDAFLTTLSPHIGNAVTGQYGELTQYALYDIEILSIERTHNGRTFGFNIVLKVYPFEEAHNYIGADTLTLEVMPSGVNVTSYKHQKYR
ncbi:DUF3888 domain-containing protein [Rossellomorea vietnamensis]|uniref:DUF3888 domain-containing protein n=2 Tax=Rossellomorea TaxID=2837508 RepID=A0A5D4KBJ1_9BACI|nr:MULTISPECIES: DUF3888 domain-containing protein [Rossellomorea]TYR74764.1 DUF3888 domain-containing protein [Rossellomorea vietnamensis]TYS74946.1 DUF3888 domain-containing protein [Rossellomorea aquimaris]